MVGDRSELSRSASLRMNRRSYWEERDSLQRSASVKLKRASADGVPPPTGQFDPTKDADGR